MPDGTSEVYVKKTKAPETSTVWGKEQKQNSAFVCRAGLITEWEWEITHSGDVKQRKNVALKMRTVSSSQACWTQLRSVDLEERKGSAREETFEVRQVNVMYL